MKAVGLLRDLEALTVTEHSCVGDLDCMRAGAAERGDDRFIPGPSLHEGVER